MRLAGHRRGSVEAGKTCVFDTAGGGRLLYLSEYVISSHRDTFGDNLATRRSPPPIQSTPQHHYALQQTLLVCDAIDFHRGCSFPSSDPFATGKRHTRDRGFRWKNEIEISPDHVRRVDVLYAALLPVSSEVVLDALLHVRADGRVNLVPGDEAENRGEEKNKKDPKKDQKKTALFGKTFGINPTSTGTYAGEKPVLR